MPRNPKNNSNRKNNQHSPMSHSSNPNRRPAIPASPSPPPAPPAPNSIDVLLLPADREALFARLDSAIESAAEEEAGRIPKDLLVGPDLRVESAGKKRRIVPAPVTALSQHTSITAPQPKGSPDTGPVPVLSSPSSASLSMDSSNNSHTLDKSFFRKAARIISPTLISHAPSVENSTVSTSTTQKPTSAEEELSQSYALSSPIPVSPLPPLPGSVTRIMQMEDVAPTITSIHTSQPLIHISNDIRSITRVSDEPITAPVAPSSTSAAIIIDGDYLSQQAVSSPEKHRTSLDEPEGSTRPTKKLDDRNNKNVDKSLSTSIEIERHSRSNSSSPPPAPPSPTRGGRSKKEKAVLTTVANRIGSRRKQHVAEGPSTVQAHSSTKFTRSAIRSGVEIIAEKSGSVIEIDDDSDGDGGKDNRIPIMITQPPLLTTTSGSTASKSLDIASSTSTSQSKRTIGSIPNVPIAAHTTSAGKAASPPVRLYVIPTFMDKLVYSLSRERVLQLNWEWLGPLEKILPTDPRGSHDAHPLDQERTTHIVTALSDMDKVKKFFRVETIDPKIEVVNNIWLTDTILYKRPMEPEGYRVTGSKPQKAIMAPAANTPPLSNTSALSEEPGTVTQPRHAKFEGVGGIEGGDQQDFNDIVLGIKEGSLEGGELSEDDHGEDQEQSQESEEDYNKAGGGDGKGKEAESSTGASKLAPEDLKKLKKENRCFECQEQGHWANKCPKAAKGATKDDVLLQIISSGKSEGKRRSKILYRCQDSHTAGQKDEPRYNKAILEQLKILMDHYETSKVKGSNEHFKVINYRKAITAIRALDYEITSEEMALKVPRVGKKLAQKIGECVALGRIKKLDHLNWDQEKSKTEALFRSVYGVGSEKATELYNKGLRTLDDLRALPDLNKNQISGLRFYDDLLKRIPRSEVEQIGKVVEAAAHRLHPEIQSQVTGSYRRGKPDCGDIDIVVARPNIDNGDELFMIMDHILNDLINQGFLVDHLSLPAWESNMATRPKHFKYMGICKLPGENQIHRHIDILVVPWMHLGAVLLYFTGNDICNRSMRLLAANRGMRLSDKGLFDNVLRGKNRKKVNEGRWVAGRTEREIFDYLKIKYLEPYEREC